jgi:ankyrin repeat protein
VKTLLKQGADANSRWGEGEFQQAVLVRAVMRGGADMVAALLKAGADPEYGNGRDMTPLFIASILGEADIIEALLDGGAKINAATPDNGSTALHGAAITGKEEAAKRLLERGANKDKRDKAGRTALDIAAGQRNNPVAALLR